jgi:hypothetical protein
MDISILVVSLDDYRPIIDAIRRCETDYTYKQYKCYNLNPLEKANED